MSLGLVPDAWLEDALGDSLGLAAPRVEPERRLMAIDAHEEVTAVALLDNAKAADCSGY